MTFCLEPKDEANPPTSAPKAGRPDPRSLVDSREPLGPPQAPTAIARVGLLRSSAARGTKRRHRTTVRASTPIVARIQRCRARSPALKASQFRVRPSAGSSWRSRTGRRRSPSSRTRRRRSPSSTCGTPGLPSSASGPPSATHDERARAAATAAATIAPRDRRPRAERRHGGADRQHRFLELQQRARPARSSSGTAKSRRETGRSSSRATRWQDGVERAEHAGIRPSPSRSIGRSRAPASRRASPVERVPPSRPCSRVPATG